MADEPRQTGVWSALTLWDDPEKREGRYTLYSAPIPVSYKPICRLCGCPVHPEYIATHDAYHEEQGY